MKTRNTQAKSKANAMAKTKNQSSSLIKARRTITLVLAKGGIAFWGSGLILKMANSQTPKSEATQSQYKETTMNDADYKDLTITNPATHRVIGLRIRLPKIAQAKSSKGEADPKLPLIIYSPGLGSGVANGAPWCDAWQKAGFIVVTLSHPVTNDSIWDTKSKSLKTNLQAALAGPQYGLRVSDCQFVITQCLSKSGNLGIENYIDPKKIGIAGHSYGALTAQAIAGQHKSQLDPRIKAAIAFSPTAATPESMKAMSGVQIPFFCVMGDHDDYVTFQEGVDSMKLGVPLAKRKAVYEGLPKGHKQLLILGNTDHMTFAGEQIDPAKFSRDITVTDLSNQESWKRISEITTDFWKSYFSNKPLGEQQAQFKKSVQPLISKGDIFQVG